MEIAKKKSQSTDSLRMAIETLQGDLTDTSGQKFSHCVHKDNSQAKYKECCYMNSGYLLATISELRLNNDETWKGDVKQLLGSLRSLGVLTIPQIDTNNGYNDYNDYNDYDGYNDYNSYNNRSYDHSNCSWVRQIKSKALGAVQFDMTLKLSDFPPRIES